MKKEYIKDDLTIVWQPDLCIHSGICVRGLPGVFRPKEKPWIKTDQADQNALIDQIKRCPSGALSYEINERPSQKSSSFPVLEVIKDGPIILSGPIQLRMSGREELIERPRISFCRCGASSNKPYCDGTHKKVDFSGDNPAT